MGKSFKDQLLQLGLVDKKKVAETKKKQHQAKKKKVKGNKAGQVIDENALLAKKAEEKKKARVQQLNRERDAKLQKRAEDAQIKQLIEQNKIKKDKNGVPYRFTVSGKIHRVFVTKEILEDIVAGRLGVVRSLGSQEQFEVIPKSVLEKIREINSKLFVSVVSDKRDESSDGAGQDGSGEENDPYAEYKVPDDLMW